jgi:hypothetical protein
MNHHEPIESTQVNRMLPEVLRDVPTGEFPRGKRELALFLHAAWNAGEDGRQTMRDILHELQVHGAQGAELVAQVERRYDDLLEVIEGFQETVRQAQDRSARQTERLHDAVTNTSAQIMDAAQEQSWQACDRLEQVAVDLGGVSRQLEAQSELAAEQLQVQRSAASAQAAVAGAAKDQAEAARSLTRVADQLGGASARTAASFETERAANRAATEALAETQRRLIEQLEATRRDSERLNDAWARDQRARRRQTLLSAVAGLALAVAGGAWLFANPSALDAVSLGFGSSAEPAAEVAPNRPATTTLPAGMPRSSD